MESAGKTRAGHRVEDLEIGGRELVALGQIGVEVDGHHHHTIEHRPSAPFPSVVVPADAVVVPADVVVPGRRRNRAPGRAPGVPGRSGTRCRSWMTRGRRGAIVSTMPQPPALTPEQRQAALAKAAKVRRERAEVKEKLKLGSITLSELLTTADSNETVGKMKVLSVLESLPGLGKVKARRLMDTVGISESRRLQGLGSNQREALLRETAR